MDLSRKRGVSNKSWLLTCWVNIYSFCHGTSNLEELEYVARNLINLSRYQQTFLYDYKPTDLLYRYTPPCTPIEVENSRRINRDIKKIIFKAKGEGSEINQAILHTEMVSLDEIYDHILNRVRAREFDRRLAALKRISYFERIPFELKEPSNASSNMEFKSFPSGCSSTTRST